MAVKERTGRTGHASKPNVSTPANRGRGYTEKTAPSGGKDTGRGTKNPVK